ncbi:hypothetical protein EVAR_78935_1 [Eumeta japonica]|uniref:Uncharacterized protein n=1 Tax=Eumeta variegata TaxID=151549 RepID=A0A4C1U402_EUMVA|nr:hypothetical protein EVAR_78935_1 [Eumeta japonica]
MYPRVVKTQIFHEILLIQVVTLAQKQGGTIVPLWFYNELLHIGRHSLRRLTRRAVHFHAMSVATGNARGKDIRFPRTRTEAQSEVEIRYSRFRRSIDVTDEDQTPGLHLRVPMFATGAHADSYTAVVTKVPNVIKLLELSKLLAKPQAACRVSRTSSARGEAARVSISDTLRNALFSWFRNCAWAATYAPTQWTSSFEVRPVSRRFHKLRQKKRLAEFVNDSTLP